MARIKTSSAKQKGRKFQQEAAKLITEKFQLEEGDVVSRPMGSGGVDLMMSPAARRAFPVSVECKKTAADPGHKALEQARYNAVKGTIGAVVWQTTGEGGPKGEIRFDLVEFIDWYKTLAAKDSDNGS